MSTLWVLPGPRAGGWCMGGTSLLGRDRSSFSRGWGMAWGLSGSRQSKLWGPRPRGEQGPEGGWGLPAARVTCSQGGGSSLILMESECCGEYILMHTHLVFFYSDWFPRRGDKEVELSLHIIDLMTIPCPQHPDCPSPAFFSKWK